MIFNLLFFWRHLGLDRVVSLLLTPTAPRRPFVPAPRDLVRIQRDNSVVPIPPKYRVRCLNFAQVGLFLAPAPVAALHQVTSKVGVGDHTRNHVGHVGVRARGVPVDSLGELQERRQMSSSFRAWCGGWTWPLWQLIRRP